MTDLSPLLPVVQSLKFQLHQLAQRNSTTLVAKLLHDDFEEMSRSDQCFDKQQTVDALKLGGYPPIFSEGFKLTIMVKGVVHSTLSVTDLIRVFQLFSVCLRGKMPQTFMGIIHFAVVYPVEYGTG